MRIYHNTGVDKVITKPTLGLERENNGKILWFSMSIIEMYHYSLLFFFFKQNYFWTILLTLAAFQTMIVLVESAVNIFAALEVNVVVGQMDAATFASLIFPSKKWIEINIEEIYVYLLANKVNPNARKISSSSLFAWKFKVESFKWRPLWLIGLHDIYSNLPD